MESLVPCMQPKDRERLDLIRWWNMYASGATYLHKLAVRVLLQVANILLQRGVGAPTASSTVSRETV